MNQEMQPSRGLRTGCDSFRHEKVRFIEGAASAHKTLMKSAFSASDVGFALVNIESRVESLFLTAMSLMEDAKMEDSLAEKASGIGVGLRFATRTTNEKLKIAVKCLCMVYDAPFQRLLGALEQSSKDTSDGRPSLIFDLAYTTRQMAKPINSKLSRLDLQDISHFVQ